MDISKKIAELKKDPDFAKNVGMILVHNGIIRGWSRGSHEDVTAVEITVDHEKIEKIRQEYEKMTGIYKIVVEPIGGLLKVGDDALFIIVAGDIRENVKECLSQILDKIKSEGLSKREIMA